MNAGSDDAPERLLQRLRDDPEVRERIIGAAFADLTTAVERLAGAQERTDEGLVQLAQAQQRTEERLQALADRVDRLGQAQERTEERLERLAEAQQRTEERLQGLAARVDELAQAQTRTERQLAALGGRLDQLTRVVEGLVEQVSALTGHVDWLRGDAIEWRYRERPAAYLSRIARRMHLLSPAELDDLLDAAEEAGTLSHEEADKIRAADGVFRGRRASDRTECYVVLEASVGVGLSEVERARERADLLTRTGVQALAVVGGTWVVPEAQQAASAYGVWEVTDGRSVAPAS